MNITNMNSTKKNSQKLSEPGIHSDRVYGSQTVPLELPEASQDLRSDELGESSGTVLSRRPALPLARPTLSGGKPRVLIVPNVSSWIVGQMAMHVMQRFRDRYEFWVLTDKMIRLRPDLVRVLVSSVDFIFPLTDKSFKLLRAAVQPRPLPPSIFWLHHVTSWNPSMRDAVSHADELVACTPAWKSKIEEQFPNHPITVVPHGVDANFFRRVESQRGRFGIPEGSFAVGFIGNKTSNADEGRKGLDTLETVVREARVHIPNLHVCFLGLGWDEEVRRFQQQGISANYTGFIPQSWMPTFYSSIDAHLLTSRIEGGPVTVLEAMACETAVVATRVGLVPDTIVDGENGFSAAIGDTGCMVERLRELSRSSGLCCRMGIAARATVYPHLSWATTLEQLEAPLARMEARSTRLRMLTSPAAIRTSAQLAGAVHTMDGLLWGMVSWWQSLLSPAVAARMIGSCWEGYGTLDVLRGLGLITRCAFRPGALRRKLSVQEGRQQ
jgi:glycosyltransferase involved in cell wall biosynthesis